MGIVKRMMQEAEEREYAEHLAEVQRGLDELHAAYPDEGWDEWEPEVYEDYCRVMDKDD